MDTEAPPDSETQAGDGVQVVAVPMPLRWQLSVLETPQGAKLVQVALVQGQLTSAVVIEGNDAIDLGNQLRKKGKEANSSIAAIRNAILDPSGNPISIPTSDDDDEEEEVA